jgi:hypothetical protein
MGGGWMLEQDRVRAAPEAAATDTAAAQAAGTHASIETRRDSSQ